MATSEDIYPIDDRLIMKGVLRFSKWQNVNQMSTVSLHQHINEKGICDLSQNGTIDNVLVLDSRPEFEYDVSHLKSCVRVCPEALDVDKTVERLCHKEHVPRTIVCYCSLGYRSSRYADALLNGIKQVEELNTLCPPISVYNLEGSLFKWANEKRPMIDHKERPTIFVHPFNPVWGKFLFKELRREIPEP